MRRKPEGSGDWLQAKPSSQKHLTPLGLSGTPESSANFLQYVDKGHYHVSG